MWAELKHVAVVGYSWWAVEQADCNEEHHDLRERERDTTRPQLAGQPGRAMRFSALLTSTRTRTTSSMATSRRLLSTKSKTAVSQVCRETCAVVGVSLRMGESRWKWHNST